MNQTRQNEDFEKVLLRIIQDTVQTFVTYLLDYQGINVRLELRQSLKKVCVELPDDEFYQDQIFFRKISQTILQVLQSSQPNIFNQDSFMNSIVREFLHLYQLCVICKKFMLVERGILDMSPSGHCCAPCILKHLNPIHEVVSVLCEPIQFKPTCGMSGLPMAPNSYPQHQIELRCIYLRSRYGMQENTFPHMCQIYLQDNLVGNFKPLATNSSLKKRKDKPVVFENRLLLSNNKVTIREGISERGSRTEDQHSCYLFGIYLIRIINPKQLIQKITDSQRSVDFEKKLIQMGFKDQDFFGCSVQELKIPTQCEYILDQIKIPARGKYCTHPKCFCLDHFLQGTINSEYARWKCPICKKPLFEIEIDSFIQNKIQNLKNGQKLVLSLENNSLKVIDQLQIQSEPPQKNNYQTIKKQKQQEQTSIIEISDDDDIDIPRNGVVQTQQHQQQISHKERHSLVSYLTQLQMPSQKKIKQNDKIIEID